MNFKNLGLKLRVYCSLKLRRNAEFYNEVFEAVLSQKETWIKSFKDEYYLTVVTGNGFRVRFWIANKYYAYSDEISIEEWDVSSAMFREVTPNMRKGRLSRKNQYKLALLEKELDCFESEAQKEQVSEIVKKIGGSE